MDKALGLICLENLPMIESFCTVNFPDMGAAGGLDGKMEGRSARY